AYRSGSSPRDARPLRRRGRRDDREPQRGLVRAKADRERVGARHARAPCGWKIDCAACALIAVVARTEARRHRAATEIVAPHGIEAPLTLLLRRVVAADDIVRR